MIEMEIQLFFVAVALLIFAGGSILIYLFFLKEKLLCKHKWLTATLGTITTTKTHSSRTFAGKPYSTVTVETKLFSVCDKCNEHKIHYETNK